MVPDSLQGVQNLQRGFGEAKAEERKLVKYGLIP